MVKTPNSRDERKRTERGRAHRMRGHGSVLAQGKSKGGEREGEGVFNPLTLD